MIMGSEVVTAAHFKARCLALLDEVASTGQEIVVTKRGRPVARLVPLDQPPPLTGSVRQLVGEEDFLAPLEADWTALR